MEVWHVEHSPADPVFSVMESFLHYIKSFQLGQVFLDICLDEYPFLTERPLEGVHIWVRS